MGDAGPQAPRQSARPAAAAARRERMSRVDTAWLRMDNDVNRMMIVGVWLLTPAVELAVLRQRLQQRLLRYPRFGQRVQADPLGPHWVDDTRFDIDLHVVPAELQPEPGRSPRSALQRLCGELAATPLDPERPLWQFHLVQGFEGGSALIARIHHCIGDGIALISVMMSITDGGSDPPSAPDRSPAHGHDGDAADLADLLIRPATELAIKAIGLTGDGLARTMDVLAHPEAPVQGGVDLARGSWRVAQDVLALAAMPDDSPTRLKRPPCGRKEVAWNEPLPLDEVKAVGKALGCTVNDVLLSCAAGAIGGWLKAQGEDPAGKEIRAMVPVNLRPPEQAWQLGNRFGLAPLVLPVGIANPVERVYAVQRRMDELKGSWQPMLAYAVLALSGMALKPVQDAVLDLFSRKATAVMTNVPGPPLPLRFCGSTLRQTMFWVPASGEIGVGASILSYGGGVQFGLMTDQKLCPQPQEIVDAFGVEFERLLCLVLMLPWRGQDGGPP